MGRSRSIYHLFDFILGFAVVAKAVHEDMNLVIFCHSWVRIERGYIIVVRLHAQGKCLSADTPTCILFNKTRLVGHPSTVDICISLVLWTVCQL